MSAALLAVGALVVGWNVYWSHVEKRAEKFVSSDKYYTLKMPHRGRVLVMEDKKPWKTFSVGPWDPPGPDPYEEN